MGAAQRGSLSHLLPGLVSISFRQLAPKQIVDLVAGEHLAGIEWGGDIHVPHGDLQRAREVGALTRDAGVAVAAYGSYYEAGTSEASGLAFESVLETALGLGAPLVRVWAGKAGPQQTDAAVRDRIISDLRRAAQLAAAAQVTVATESHAGTLTETAASTLDLLRSVGHPNMLTLWQPAPAQEDADCAVSLGTVLPHVVNLHVFFWGPGGFADRRPLAEGTGRWQMLFGVLRQTGREHYALLEYVADDDPQSFRRDAKTLRELLGSP
jgi:3-dehydroshikimate dehydratase